MTSQLQYWMTMIQTNTYEVLTVRQLFTPQKGDITIRKRDSRTIFIKTKPHKHHSSYLN